MKVKNYYRERTKDYISDLYMNNRLKYNHIKDCYQNEENCLAAVTKNSWAIALINNQTTKICLAIVKQSGTLLKYIINQTEEICLAAVKNDNEALYYVRDKDLKLRIKKELNL